ncbi:MAG: hypothetical protein DRJ32_00490 [Thermoprotei archaeon]|nr:MAG: hypothetical protein DRJ32_00490 [Thermoprotei archaeon]HDD63649.1 hypothetical protein [Thermoprotei archaeon]
MPKKSRKEQPIDLTSFFVEEKEEVPKPSKTAEERDVSEAARRVESYIKTNRTVLKSTLYKWAVKNNISPQELYLSLKQLIKEGKIKKIFDHAREEIAYMYV